MKHANLKALFTAIANSIRNKTGGTDAIIADDFPEVIDGIQTGGGVDKIQRYIDLAGNSAKALFYYFDGPSVDELLDGVDTSNVMSTSNMFYYCRGITTVPLFDTSKVVDMNYMFYGCSRLTTVPLFDTSDSSTMSYMFQNCSSLTSVPLFNTSKVGNTKYMFSGCSALTTVPALDMRKVADASGMFNNCSALTECRIRNIKVYVQVGSGTSYGHLLTVESLLSLCKECVKLKSAKNFGIGTANLAKLEGIYVKLIDITDEMRAEDDLIDEKYPFVQCESTDANAMTIQDYMALKMWTLK